MLLASGLNAKRVREMNDQEREYVTGMLSRTRLFFDQASIDKVRNTTFAISGLGGVGAITAELLARWGVKRFRLLDMDRYESSNLNRQLFATANTLGRYKVEVTRDRIKEINPFAQCELVLGKRVTNENVHSFVRGAGIIIQSADYPSCKLFYLSAQKHRVPVVNGYSTITGGRVQTFDYRKPTRFNFAESWWNSLKFGGMRPLVDQTEEELAAFDAEHVHPTAPTLNFVTNMIGCLMVAEAIKLLTGRGHVIHYPRYLMFNAFDYQLKIKNSNSPLNRENLKRIVGALKSRVNSHLRINFSEEDNEAQP